MITRSELLQLALGSIFARSMSESTTVVSGSYHHRTTLAPQVVLPSAT
jgi:hypothetical protein